MDFKGGTAVVTGGGHGIGAALCVSLAQHGMRVAVADVHEDRASSVAARIGENAHAYRIDVSDRDAVFVVASQVEHDLGPVNLLCANAGVVMPFGSVINRTLSDWNYVLSVNLFGVINTIDAFIEQIRRNTGNAHIMVTSSMGGMVIGGHIPLGPYSVSKYACVGYCEDLRLALADEDIGVSMLAPGVVATEIMHNSSEVRPETLGAQPAPPRDRGYVTPRLAAMAVTPERAAEAAIDGIREGYFYIPTHSNAADKLKDHYDAVINELSGQGHQIGLDD